MLALCPHINDRESELLEQRRLELQDRLEKLFPDKDLKVVRTITREQLFYLVDSGSGQVTTLIMDGEGSLRVRYPTGYTSDKLDSLAAQASQAMGSDIAPNA